MNRTSLSLLAGTLGGFVIGYSLWSNGLAMPFRTSGNEGPFPGSSRDASSTLMSSAGERTTEAVWLTEALQLVAEQGYTPEAIEQVASSLPESQAQVLRLLATPGLAGRDIQSAIAFALTLDSHTVRAAGLRKVADIAARSDPRLALDSASMIASASLRTPFVERILAVWAVVDPTGALDYLEMTGLLGNPVSAGMLAALATAEPERLPRLMDELPLQLRTNSERALIDALLVSDPDSVYARIEAQRNGFQNTMWDVLLIQIASRHIRIDPKAALSHLLSLRAPLANVAKDALLAIPEEDFEAEFSYALNRYMQMLMSGEIPRGFEGTLREIFSAAFERGSPGIAALVDRVANHPSMRVRNELVGLSDQGSIIARWAESDPASAVAWTIRNASRVSPAIVERLGSLFAAGSVDQTNAQATLQALPEALRGYWMAGVAQGLAASSLDNALEWLEPARGAPVYSTVMDDVLSRAAQREPAVVAQIIGGLPEAPGFASVLIATVRWGTQEPARAGDWLVRSQNIDDDWRVQVIRLHVLNWAERDLGNSKVWAQRLDSGALRDSALGAVVETAAAAGSVDPELLGQFSSDRSRAEALIGAMDGLRHIDPDQGRRVIDQYITDPALRETAVQHLEGRAPPEYWAYIGGIAIR